MITQKIRDYLRENGIRQSWLAEKLNMSDSKLSLILNNNAPLYADVLYNICGVLEVSSECFNPKAA